MAENERETKQYSLKEREYVGDDGQIHHHTNVYMAAHEGDSARQNGSGSRAASASSGSGSGKSSARGSEGESSRSRSGTSRGSEEGRSEGGKSRSGTSRDSERGRGSRAESRSRGGRESENEAGSEREGGGLGRAVLTAAVVGLAAVAAASLLNARRGSRESGVRQPDDLAAGYDERFDRDRDRDRDGGNGMY